MSGSAPIMRSRWRPTLLVLVLVVGLVLGSVVSLVVQDRRAAGDLDRNPVTVAGVETGTGSVDLGASRGVVAPGPPTQRVLLAWAAEPLPPDLSRRVTAVAGVERVTAVRRATIDLVESREGGRSSRPPDGFAVPLDAIGVDPTTYPTFVPPDHAATFARLGSTDAVLSRTGAELRGVGVGAEVVVTSGSPTATDPAVTLVVVAVVDDAVIGGAELAVTADHGASLGLGDDRYLLVAHRGERAAIEDAVREVLAVPVRFRGPGETPFLRDGDAVLPQATVKASFGEFALRRDGGQFEQEAAWQQEHLVDGDLPVLGTVRCHRAILDDLRAALEQIEQDNLASLIDPSSRGCWYPDTIDRTGALSRGFWGTALVLNPTKNPSGSGSVQDPRVVAVLQAHGFTWGGDFLIPEPAYFEHVGRTFTSSG